MTQIIKEGSSWDDVQLPSFSSLEGAHEADALIVGGGITGITAAYHLSKQGLRVILIEKEKLAFGATGATTAFITSVIDTDMRDLVKLPEGRAIVDSHRDAIDEIARIIDTEEIDCDFMRCSNFVYAKDASQKEPLEGEFDAAKELGYEPSWVPALEIPNAGAFEIPNQGKFHPLKYLKKLVEIAKDNGVQFYEHTPATKLEYDGDATVTTEKGRIRARFCLIATYEPFTKPLSLYFKKAFYTSYMYAGSLQKNALPEGIYEDLSNPYTYFRIDGGEGRDRFIIGGQDHRSDVKVSPEKNFKALADETARLFSTSDYRIERSWDGPILEPIDGYAFIGEFGTPSIYIAMGFSGNGMTYGTIAALMFAEHVQGKKSQWSRLYDPSRVPGMRELYIKGRDYTGEFIGGAVHNAITYRA